MAVRGSLLLLLLGAAAGARAGTVEVLHDNWGVPHIYASDDAAMAFGYGHSTAEDHGELCLSLYAGARCRAAQYYGGPLGGLAKSLVDRFLLSFGVRTMGEKYYADASDFTRSIMDGFGAGFSEYVHTHRELFSAEALAVVVRTQPLSPFPTTTVPQLKRGLGYRRTTATSRAWTSRPTQRSTCSCS
eukprot:COSAG04_NODE_57_length_30587_cov_86.784632_20_plen_187_part_00